MPSFAPSFSGGVGTSLGSAVSKKSGSWASCSGLIIFSGLLSATELEEEMECEQLGGILRKEGSDTAKTAQFQRLSSENLLVMRRARPRIAGGQRWKCGFAATLYPWLIPNPWS